MWIAKIALHRPYTFVVLALLILLLGIFTGLRIPIDIFPNINIPVVAAIWGYTGLSPSDMANSIILLTEKNAQTDVSNAPSPSDSMETGTLVRILVPHPLPRPQPQSPSAPPATPGQSGRS